MKRLPASASIGTVTGGFRTTIRTRGTVARTNCELFLKACEIEGREFDGRGLLHHERAYAARGNCRLREADVPVTEADNQRAAFLGRWECAAFAGGRETKATGR